MDEKKVAELVQQFQCSGCVAGSDVQCGKFKLKQMQEAVACESHVLGTYIMGAGHIALGLPKGFCRSGFDPSHPGQTANQMDIRLWAEGTTPKWDRLNVAVWAMEKDGFLFVRTYAPRINWTVVDVIEGGKLSLVPNAINVGEFFDEID